MRSGIPARIIQTGRSNDLPLLIRAAAANLRCLNPSFEYRFFDDADVIAFIDSEFPEYREVFDSFPFRIQQYDFFRYLAVFRLGGFYFDTDVFFATGLEELLGHSCVFPFEELTVSGYLRWQHQMDWEIGNYGFGAAPGHPFLLAVIKNCIRARQDPEWGKPMMQGIPRLLRAEYYVLNTTGPGLVSRTLAENPELAKDVTILFPKDVCDENTWHHFGELGVHTQEGSWRSKDGYVRRKLANLWEARVRRRLFRESLARGKSRSVPGSSAVPGQLHPPKSYSPAS
jgi:inositol phosphorylceramide mannosyltransferase catalytic subunit